MADKKPRKPRRNFALEVATLKMHCEISIQVVEEMQERLADPNIDVANNLGYQFNKGQLAALKTMLARLQ